MSKHLVTSREFRDELQKRGGDTASRCYQCATCSTICDLAGDGAAFPRKQMAKAQWGLYEELAGDPGVWLCHNCNDCSDRCPRNARPGDVLQAVRSIMTERLAFPRFMGTLVGKAGSTWPLLIGVPMLFWLLFIYGVTGFNFPASFDAYDQLVPHWMIYTVYFTVTGFAALAALIGGMRYWSFLGQQQKRQGSFVSNLIPALVDIATHKRFGQCVQEKPRKLGHLALFYGFVGAAVTSGFIIVYMYIEGKPLPVPILHPYKLLGNLSAIALVIGGVWLMYRRWFLPSERGKSTAFDNFFMGVVLLLIATGILTEVARFSLPPMAAIALYILHLGTVVTLFATFPYSKFAHMLYRILAMVHERMAVTTLVKVSSESGGGRALAASNQAS
ncbi:MAG: quinone-interacting membrane-bound oxidoreductase complex subunit QmoC [Pseudomonadota bacterium]